MSNNPFSLSRRTFMTTAAAVGVTGLSAGTAWGKPQEKFDVVVVGAGLSGLHAAEMLQQQGLTVAVAEASDRVGGRLRTGRTEGYTAELGGSEVGAYYGRVRDACRRLNVGLVGDGPKPTHFMLNVRGQSMTADAWENSPANMTIGSERAIAPYLLQNKFFFDWLPFDDPAEWLNPEFFPHDVSAAAYMRARGVSEEAIRLANFDLNGPSLDAVSAMSIFRDLARIKMEGFTNPNKPQYGVRESLAAYIEGGSDMLPRAMAASLNEPVRLNAPVVRIEQSGDVVETVLKSGDVLKSDYMVMAAPFSALKNITFNPGLPKVQANAVFGAKYSATTQFHFKVLKPFWEQDGLPPSIWSDDLFERAFVISNRGGEFGSLIVWLNGDGGTLLNAMPLDKQQAFIMQRMEAARPAIKGALKPFFSYSWEKNPYVTGNKHVFGAGQVKSFAADMGKAHGRIHFSGEHLRRIEPGMESAMETAEIAVIEILERM